MLNGAIQEFEEEEAQAEPLQVVSMRLPPGLVRELDRIAQAGPWANRSQLVREMLISVLMTASPELESMEKTLAGVLDPVLPDLLEAIRAVLEQIPREVLLKAVRDFSVPLAHVFSRVTNIPAPVLQDMFIKGISGLKLKESAGPADEGTAKREVVSE